MFSGQPTDGLAAARELERDFVDRPDMSARDFVAKLQDQLAATSAAGVQMAAELLYVHTLIVSTNAFKAKNKLELVNKVLEQDAHRTRVRAHRLDAVPGVAVRDR